MAERPTSDEVAVPDSVRSFVGQLQRHLALGGSAAELQQLVEQSFLRLSERHFKTAPWPAPASLGSLVASTAPEHFPLVYAELYFRHIYARLSPSLQNRLDSWRNYVALFDWLCSLPAALPEQWSWDVVDEFVYQFQSFQVYRAKLKNKTPEEVDQLKGLTDVWSSSQVLALLERLATTARSLALGVFATVGLVRVRCMLSDYEVALKTLDGWDLTPLAISIAAQLSLAHTVGFAYLMLGRHADTVRTISKALLSVNRLELPAKTYQYEHTLKKVEQLVALLALASALGRVPLDESLRLVLRDKLGESKLVRVQRGESATCEELFCFACPKFIAVTPPSLDADPSINYTHELLKGQLKKLHAQTELHARLESVRGLLKLYTSIEVAKVARFLDTTEENIRETLELLKQSNRQFVWKSGSLMSGEWIEVTDIDFIVENGVIQVKDQRKTTSHGDYFRAAISRLEEVISANQRPK